MGHIAPQPSGARRGEKGDCYLNNYIVCYTDCLEKVTLPVLYCLPTAQCVNSYESCNKSTSGKLQQEETFTYSFRQKLCEEQHNNVLFILEQFTLSLSLLSDLSDA
jgi:hypothetical protein